MNSKNSAFFASSEIIYVRIVVGRYVHITHRAVEEQRCEVHVSEMSIKVLLYASI